MQPMVRVLAVGLSLLVVACGGGTPQAQEEAAPAADPAQAPGGASVLGDLIQDWERQKDALMGIAAAMPEEMFGYKSTPAQRSYGEQIMHIATVNVGLLKLVGGASLPPSFTADNVVATKAEMLQALAESYDHGIALLNEQTDASMHETIDAAFLGPSTRARLFWFLLGHSMDTYGQMAVYLRLNDIVPPASRGV
jgi:uncharacterized damage-inducible protein DinB